MLTEKRGRGEKGTEGLISLANGRGLVGSCSRGDKRNGQVVAADAAHAHEAWACHPVKTPLFSIQSAEKGRGF
jgi:hypothetical protein